MLIRLKPLSLAMAGATLLTLAACGGGGDPVPEPVPPPTTKTPVKVIDGAIRNALVCLDQNRNGVCDAGETQGRTDATGSVTLDVPDAEVGKYPVVAMVGTDAVDADSGPVTVAYSMTAPADQPAVVSPLTTIVQQVAQSNGQSSAQAAALLTAQTGLDNLFADYTQTAGPNAVVARSIVVTTQSQGAALGSAVGAAVPGGGTVTDADLTRAIQSALAQILPQLVAAVFDPAVQAACSADIGSSACTAALETQMAPLVAATGLTTATIPMQVAVSNALANPVNAPETPTAGASLDWLAFTDANNWFYRVFVATASENTPDANGLRYFRDFRRQNIAGTTTSWVFSSDAGRRDDVHFNGTAWVNCPLGTLNPQTSNDAQGRNENGYCNGYSTGTNVNTEVNISGQTLSSVVDTLRNFPSTWGTLSYRQWGTSSADGSDMLVLGSATFPAGSKLYYRTGTNQNAAVGYDVRASNEIKVYSAAVVAGGDARNAPSHACNSAETNTGVSIPVTTLEQLMGASTGTPCVFSQSSLGGAYTALLSDDPNEWWSQSTLSIGSVGSVSITATPTGYYTGNKLIRVAFVGSGANAITYYSCKQRVASGSSRNCTAIGTGTYTISALGDARILKLNNPPAEAASLSYERVVVERGGKVYWGYQDKPSTFQRARLNLEATNALFTQIGIPTVTP